MIQCAVPENICIPWVTEGIGIFWGQWGSARHRKLKKCMKEFAEGAEGRENAK